MTKKRKMNRPPVLKNQPDVKPPDAVMSPQTPGNLRLSAKVCRLCETKDGPFLDIFEAANKTGEKINEVMPFNITENDELPHNICFRCSAKVEEIDEYVKKCIKTQSNFYSLFGKKCPISTNKIKVHRSMYEAKLMGNNLSYDDVCEASITSAMKGMKDIPSSLKLELETMLTSNKKQPVSKSSPKLINEIQTEPEAKRGKVMPIKPDVIGPKSMHKDGSKSTAERSDKPQTRLLRSKNVDPTLSNTKAMNDVAVNPSKVSKANANLNNVTNGSPEDVKNLPKNNKVEEDLKKPEPEVKPFNIMEHVIMIKVNHVGLLYQCKLCNRNFLKEEVVLSHGCAKKGIAKNNFIKPVTPPEVPKVPTVKYINTKTDTDTNKPKLITNINTDTNINTGNKNKEQSNDKPKPRIGPASRVKKIQDEPLPAVGTQPESTPPPASDKKAAPSLVQYATTPNLNSRYKLVPGPNNTYTLVEVSGDAGAANEKTIPGPKIKMNNKIGVDSPVDNSQFLKVYRGAKPIKTETTAEVIDLVGESVSNKTESQPYPVGLFKSMKHLPSEPQPLASCLNPLPVSAPKKPSYTVVNTGHPNKLLLSTKPQYVQASKRKGIPSERETHKEPFTITHEVVTPPNNNELINFMNIDPLLQPSYVLPTNNVIIPEAGPMRHGKFSKKIGKK